jgi:hypothetical protein
VYPGTQITSVVAAGLIAPGVKIEFGEYSEDAKQFTENVSKIKYRFMLFHRMGFFTL